MGLFGRIFKKEDKEESNCEKERTEQLQSEDMTATCERERACDEPEMAATILTVLGPGCKRCHQLNENAQAVALKVDGVVSVEYITDPVAIAEAGIMSTPALLVNGKIASQGKVLTQSEIEKLL